MLTKFYLHYDNITYELKDDDLYNWDQVMCSYKRGNYGGVVRSFTSQFVFVNKAREILLVLYLRDRYNAQASISVHTITNRWEWEQKFICPLDFSTVQWEKYTFTVNAVDNSLAALIKANKSTKYEFAVDSDIIRDALFKFDRIPMKESLTYGFTQGTSFDNNADIDVSFEKDAHPFVGNFGSEIYINGIVDWQDDQSTDSSSFLFSVKKDIEITLCADLEWRTDKGENYVSFGVFIMRGGSYLPTSNGATDGNGGWFVACRSESWNNISASNPGQLPDYTSIEENLRKNSFSIISGKVWILQYNGHGYIWVNKNKTASEYFINRTDDVRIPLNLQAGDKVVILHSFGSNSDHTRQHIQFTRSKLTFDWLGVGNSESVDVFSPKTVATQLLRRIAGGAVNVDVSISSYDSRLAKTYIMAAESLRGIGGAKFYSSFNEFCDWMSTVFGYIYYIGSPKQSKYRWIRVCGQIEGSPWQYVDERFDGSTDSANIVYIPSHAKFLYYDEAGGTLYSEWSGCEMYNDPVTGHPRTDTLFRIIELSNSNLYYFDDYSGGSLHPNLYDHSEDYIGNDGQTVYFVHRSELLNPSAEVKRILNCRGIKYNVDTSVLYSTITVGYDKKDYDNINGRDEFNFNNTYSTGCDVSDKTLSLISKYRADCYGMEFAVQKRGADTTDSSSDKDVFFVLCTSINGELIADRTMPVTNSLTGAVFNGAFSPMACVRANAGFIGLQADDMTLKFASSTGNSEIVINGEPMSSDITLNTPLATSGWIEFTTDEVDDIANVDDLVEVVDEEGRLYRGFLKEVDVKYAKTEAAKYKLIIKDIEP